MIDKLHLMVGFPPWEGQGDCLFSKKPSASKLVAQMANDGRERLAMVVTQQD